jgi:hypothetical protein
MHQKKASNEIMLLPDTSFHACIMAAIQMADTDNLRALAIAFPDIALETFIRYHAPGACVSVEEWLSLNSQGDEPVEDQLMGYLTEKFGYALEKAQKTLADILAGGLID